MYMHVLLVLYILAIVCVFLTLVKKLLFLVTCIIARFHVLCT